MRENGYIGRCIGNYQIVAHVGSGGFGSVYRGVHTILTDRIVALKILHTYLASKEECDRFLEEARMLEYMHHPHILHIFDVGIDDGVPYLITEYAPNGSLRDLIKQYATKGLPVEMSLSILSQVGEALDYAHQRNIVHRDLKPENILFNAEGSAILADFGIATQLTTSSVKHVTVIGTPSYMAPEHFQGSASKESDQYALACIAYELFTGQVPFLAPDFLALGFKHLTEMPIAPTQLNPELPVHIEAAVLKAMSKQRGDRYATMGAFISAIQGNFPTSDSTAILSLQRQQLSLPSTYLPTLPGSQVLVSHQEPITPVPAQTPTILPTWEARSWKETGQLLPLDRGTGNGATVYPERKQGWGQRKTMVTIAGAVVALLIVASLLLAFLPPILRSNINTETGYNSLNGTATRSTTIKSSSSPTSHPTSIIGVANSDSTKGQITPGSTSTGNNVQITPETTPTSAPTATPSLTPTPTSHSVVSETLYVDYIDSNATGTEVSTQHTYSGKVSLTISGYGQAYSTRYSDAFYIYTDQSGNPVTPYTNIRWILYINGNPADDSVGLPAYTSSHVYTVTMTLSQPGTINFGIRDSENADNTGSLTITVQQE